MPRISSRLSVFSVPFTLGALGALAACTSPDLSQLDLNTLEPAVDLAAPADGSEVAARTMCKPAATIELAAPLAELRAATPTTLTVKVSESGDAKAAHPVKLVLAAPDGTPLKTLLDAAKPLGAVAVDFTPGAEKDLPTGALQLKATVGCPAGSQGKAVNASATLYLVRLGATQLHVGDGEGGGRVPLMFHALNRRSGGYFPIPEAMAGSSLSLPAGEPELDQLDGTPRRFPDKPWADLSSPPVDASGKAVATGQSLPVSLVLGTRPDLVFTVGKSAQRGGATQPTGLTASGLPPLRLVVDGIPGSDATPLSEGGTVTVRLPTSPVPAISRVDQTVTWHFEWKGGDGTYQPLAGSEQSTQLRFYGVLGNEQGTVSPDLPWVAVVDEATRAIAGAASDAAGARDLLVKHIYEEVGLTYDRKSGASQYTDYPDDWDAAVFYLADYLKRSRGSIVNCSDCASILSTYANMIGAKLHYAIIGPRFSLNAILGIGATMFGSPFDSGRFSFSYHAVTTADATMTIHDATLAVDGDSDATTAPHTKLLVQGLTGSDYLTRLSPTYGTGTPDYQHDDQITHVR